MKFHLPTSQLHDRCSPEEAPCTCIGRLDLTIGIGSFWCSKRKTSYAEFIFSCKIDSLCVSILVWIVVLRLNHRAIRSGQYQAHIAYHVTFEVFVSVLNQIEMKFKFTTKSMVSLKFLLLQVATKERFRSVFIRWHVQFSKNTGHCTKIDWAFSANASVVSSISYACALFVVVGKKVGTCNFYYSLQSIPGLLWWIRMSSMTAAFHKRKA